MTATRLRETEAQFQRCVIEAAQAYGWAVHAQRPGRTQRGWRVAIQGLPGWPDVVCVRPGAPGAAVILELKMPPRRPTLAQVQWIAWLNDVPGITARVVYPDDWDEIICLLSRPPARPVTT
jgi:hypothetical protein